MYCTSGIWKMSRCKLGIGVILITFVGGEQEIIALIGILINLIYGSLTTINVLFKLRVTIMRVKIKVTLVMLDCHSKIAIPIRIKAHISI